MSVNVHGILAVIVIIAGVVTALTAIALASRQPPLKQIGQLFGFIVKRLMGDPAMAWFDHRVKEQILPVAAENVKRVLDETLKERTEEVRQMVREEVVEGLTDHMAREESELRTTRTVTETTRDEVHKLSGEVRAHVAADQEAFKRVEAGQKELLEKQAGQISRE